jgi:predicted metal-dependent hydrolase
MCLAAMHTTTERTDAHVPIPVRDDMRFDFSDDVDSHWCRDNLEFNHIANAFMQALPYLEPYFINAIREAGERIEDPQLKDEIDAYIAQEARHAQEHRRFNKVLHRRYPGLKQIEAEIKGRLEQSRKHDSLEFRMAYTAGYEAITFQNARFMLLKKDKWLSAVDESVFGMLIWHMVEEVEHKNVAFDAFQAIDGRYSMRLRGFRAAATMTVKDIYVMVKHMLEVDGLWPDPRCKRRLRRVALSMAGDIVPGFWHYFMPNHHPSDCADPQLVERWRDHYAAGSDLRVINSRQMDSWLA